MLAVLPCVRTNDVTQRARAVHKIFGKGARLCAKRQPQHVRDTVHCGWVFDHSRAPTKTVASFPRVSTIRSMAKITVSVQRREPESGQPPHFETHEVELSHKASVLDA